MIYRLSTECKWASRCYPPTAHGVRLPSVRSNTICRGSPSMPSAPKSGALLLNGLKPGPHGPHAAETVIPVNRNRLLRSLVALTDVGVSQRDIEFVLERTAGHPGLAQLGQSPISRTGKARDPGQCPLADPPSAKARRGRIVRRAPTQFVGRRQRLAVHLCPQPTTYTRWRHVGLRAVGHASDTHSSPAMAARAWRRGPSPPDCTSTSWTGIILLRCRLALRCPTGTSSVRRLLQALEERTHLFEHAHTEKRLRTPLATVGAATPSSDGSHDPL